MSKKHRRSQFERQQRRVTEMRKANERSYSTVIQVSSGSPKLLVQEPQKDNVQDSELRFTLPVAAIKKDLRINIFYLVFCLGILIILSKADLNYIPLFNFLSQSQ